MRHTITFTLSQAAQAAAARAGLSAAKEQTIELPVDLVGRALDLGASVGYDGSVTLVAQTAVWAAC